jgi:3-phenylpropionate/trans-cinnamate dioxygenase ferredoxin reductase component
MVIVGAGETGASAALELRRAGWRGGITLIGAETQLPYERPPLSKALFGADGPPDVKILSDTAYREHSISLIRGVTAVAVDRSQHLVRLSMGCDVRYDRLLLATGAAPRRLQVPGADRVFYLRNLDHAFALRARLAPGMRLTIVGGGFIGLEVAASARSHGIDVTLLEGLPRLLTRGVSPAYADSIRALHAHHGVDVLMSATVAALEYVNGETRVVLASGERLESDCVVAGIGAIPETQLAESAGLTLQNGVAVDEYLRTEDPDIFAAGDCCSFPHALYGGRRIRLEAWRNARAQAEAAAINMTGVSVPYSAVPWFWSDQYDQTLQIAGLVEEGSQIISRDTRESQMAFHLASDGRLVAASALGPNSQIARDIKIAERLIARSARPDPDLLAATESPLKRLLVN